MTDPCKRTARDALLYRDGGLSPSEREAFAGHLEGCSSCRARVEDAKAVASLLREAFELSEMQLPRGFSDRVMNEVQRRPAGRAVVIRPKQDSGWLDSLFGGWRWIAVGGLALAAAIATVVVPLMSTGRNPAPANEAQQELLREENEAHVHRLSVESSDTHPVVLQTAEGRTVIWMISDSQFGADAGQENP